MKPISQIAETLGLNPAHVFPYGDSKAKVSLDALKDKAAQGKLILVSAITPTPAGEGKTVTSIGLAQGLQKIGKSVALALRQPSMGPVFGRKGGATGGGRSTVQPAQDINLHFTGDFHAITSANNLLASVIDNQLHFEQTRLSPTGVHWKRVLDANDRALRHIHTSVGGNTERSTGFDITAASEIMAILCLASSREDLRKRLDRIVVGFTHDGEPVRASEFRITGSLLALLREAILPNLVQTAEGVPTFIHGGPFANIAHGCNSVLATKMALAHADYAVTESGFAFDLGGEKFLDIKCRQSGLAPDAIVLVATIRALKMHGGIALADLSTPDPDAVAKGMANLKRHVESARSFGRPVTVAINSFPDDSDEEFAVIKDYCDKEGISCAHSRVFAEGGAGGVELAETVLRSLEEKTSPLQFVYPDEAPVHEKLKAIVTRIYGGSGVDLTEQAEKRLALFERAGFSSLPVCMAKTQNSLSDDPKMTGCPKDFRVTVRDFELAAGAGFIVALTGQMMRMPALPRVPAAEHIDVNEKGEITGILGT